MNQYATRSLPENLSLTNITLLLLTYYDIFYIDSCLVPANEYDEHAIAMYSSSLLAISSHRHPLYVPAHQQRSLVIILHSSDPV